MPNQTAPPHGARLAFDRGSVRRIDQDGRMHVEITNISKANVCAYLGREIPGAEQLGLDMERIYRLFRDPEELAKAAPSFNNIPLLSEHVPVTVDDHRPGLVVGATGSDAEFKAPYLRNSLVVWAADAIAGIENDEQRELSCAYRYIPDMTSGTYEGEPYDGVMRQIQGNHVALVPKGRAGSDVVVGDSQPKEIQIMSKKALSRKATLAKGALLAVLKPKLAADAALDLNSILQSVNHANWLQKKAGIVAAIKPKLAADADVEDVVKLLDSLDGEADPVAKDDDIEPAPAKPGEGEMPAADASPIDEILGALKGKLSDEDHAALSEKLKALKLAEEKPAQDEPPRTAGTPEAPGATSNPNPEPVKKDDAVDKPAMDAAIAAAVKTAEANTVARMRSIQAAEDAVKPYVGKLAIAADSADAVYKAALDTLGVNIEGVHPSAFKAILEAQRKPGEQAPRIAADAQPQGLADRFPDLAAVRSI